MVTSTLKKPAIIQNSMLEKFFVEEIKDIYGAEKLLQKNLNKLMDAASSPKLKNVLEDHNKVTVKQISRLENIFKLLGRRPQIKKCDIMEGLLDEAYNVIKETEKNTLTREVALIIIMQKLEHYEIATYGGLKQIAITLGLNNVSANLLETLGEEKEMDELLTDISKNDINYKVSTDSSVIL